MSKYTIYIDENGTGNNSYSKNDRFLALTGVIIELDYDKNQINSSFASFKQKHQITNSLLHREDIINKKKGYEFLSDPTKQKSFDKDLLDLISQTQFTCLTVVIDKESFVNQYKVWRKHPYHYCIEVLIERFILFLEEKNCSGKMIIESRGKKDDKTLKSSYDYFMKNGTDFISSNRIVCKINASLEISTKPITLKNKIYGLELADIVSHPSMHYVRNYYSLPASQARGFGLQIQSILQSKYRSYKGRIDRCGFKLLP